MSDPRGPRPAYDRLKKLAKLNRLCSSCEAEKHDCKSLRCECSCAYGLDPT